MRPTKLTLLLAALAALLLQPGTATAASAIVSQHGRLRVQGSKIVGEHGEPVSVAGVSYGWSQWQAARFYNAGTVNWVVNDWHAQIIRAPLGIHAEPGDYLKDPAGNLARVTAVVDAALAAGVYVIIDWHDHHAEQHTMQAAAFFADMARRYGDRPNVIYEIYNEPIKISWSKAIKPYAETVIAAIRAIDPDNLILVGTPNWSQDVDVAAADPIKDANTAYTLHFYAGTHKQSLRAKAETAMQLGAALFVSEWGTCDASGAGPIDEPSTREWLAFMRQHQLSHCNWGINDKKETASIVLPSAAATGNWADQDLSPSGRYVRDLIRGWSSAGP